jgi:hypothetical protein
MRGRLNLFQATMLRWRELHPYCAAHVIAIERPFDDARARSAIDGVLEECGLTGFDVDPDRRRYAFDGTPSPIELAVVDEDAEPFDAAALEIERSINRPFPRGGRYCPFRFFAVPAEGRFLLGIVYDHFVAGGDSVVVLLTDIADRYASDVEASRLPRLDAYPPGYARLFARLFGYLLRAVPMLPSLVAGWRSAVRPRLRDPADGHNGFVRCSVDAERYARLRAAAKSWGVTVNDVLLATVMQACAPLYGERSPRKRRHQLAAASIVNVRADYQPPPLEVFGQFLSSFRVVHPVPPDVTLGDLARALAVQTGDAKRRKLYLVTLIALWAAALLWPFAPAARRQRMYLKYHPVCAGLTPLNVNALRRRGRSADGDYLRAASTGPMSPMVVAPTTAGAALQVGITYRTTALSRADVDGVVERMNRLLTRLWGRRWNILHAARSPSRS